MAHSLFHKMLHDDFNSDEEFVIIAKIAMGEGSTPCRRRREINRDRLQGHESLFLDYFAESPTYPSKLFRRTDEAFFVFSYSI
jgi:hypothetical protein